MFDYLIVEPHADDAFLSLGGHIEAWIKEGKRIGILTVFSGTRNRKKDAEAYASKVGAQWFGAGLTGETEGLNSGQIDLLSEFVGSFTEEINATILPLGIYNGDHKDVRVAFEAFTIDSYVFYYLDQPYASLPKHTKETNNLLHGMEIYSYLKPHGRKYRHIRLFRDQSKFFYYNPAEKLIGNIELIVTGWSYESS